MPKLVLAPGAIVVLAPVGVAVRLRPEATTVAFQLLDSATSFDSVHVSVQPVIDALPVLAMTTVWLAPLPQSLDVSNARLQSGGGALSSSCSVAARLAAA